MTSVTCVQPLLVVPSLASAWNVVQSVSRRYTSDSNVRSHVRKRPQSTASQNETSTRAIPPDIPDWVHNAYTALDVGHLSADIFSLDANINRLMGNSVSPTLHILTSPVSTSERISSATFFENRCGFPERHLGSFAPQKVENILPTKSIHMMASESLSRNWPSESRWLKRQSAIFFQQTRGFKTRRSGTSSGLGQHRAQGEGLIPSFKDLRASPLFDRWNVGGGFSAAKTDRFQSLLSEAESSSSSAQDRMKVHYLILYFIFCYFWFLVLSFQWLMIFPGTSCITRVIFFITRDSASNRNTH